MTLASHCSWADRFGSNLVENPEDRFSLDEAQISLASEPTILNNYVFWFDQKRAAENFLDDYRKKIKKIWSPGKIAVIILSIEQRCFTTERYVQKIQTEWQKCRPWSDCSLQSDLCLLCLPRHVCLKTSNSVSSQCARDKSFIVWNTEVHPEIFLTVKNVLKM